MKRDMNQEVVQRLIAGRRAGNIVERPLSGPASSMGVCGRESPPPPPPPPLSFAQTAGMLLSLRADMRTQRSTFAPSRLIAWVPGRKSVVMIWSIQNAFSSGRKSRRRPARKLRDWQ